MDVHPASKRYSLRDSSKSTSRYRNYLAENVQDPQTPTDEVSPSIVPVNQPQHQQSSPKKQQGKQKNIAFRRQPVRFVPSLVPSSDKATAESGNQIQQIVVKVRDDVPPPSFDGTIGAEQEITTSEYKHEVAHIISGAIRISGQGTGYWAGQRMAKNRSVRLNYGAEMLSDELKWNLRKLKNVLKLPKARRFVFCEFFYSGVDQQIFLAENEFSQLMQESFPNLKCKKIRRPEWREVRKLVGKPRRCSQAFFDEERSALEEKRQKVRQIYNGICTSMNEEIIDLPAYLPRPPVVGQKIYARVRSPKDGIYAANVDAIAEDGGYRVVFDDKNIQPCVIKDFEVMFDQPSELLSIHYFLEQNRANARSSSKQTALPNSGSQEPIYHPTPITMATPLTGGSISYEHRHYGPPSTEVFKTIPLYSAPVNETKKATIGKDEKVGNFPVRMLVILVKLCKVIEYKKQLIGQLTLVNDFAEKMNTLSNEYPEEFKTQFSQIVLDMETINRLFHNYLSALATHYNTLLPHLNEPHPTDRPELLRKTCNTNAFQIVKHCNAELNVRNKRILHLITSLASMMLQLSTIGKDKKKFSISDTNILSESLKQIHSQIAPKNTAAFQDYVEVNMKQMFSMMMAK